MIAAEVGAKRDEDTSRRPGSAGPAQRSGMSVDKATPSFSKAAFVHQVGFDKWPLPARGLRRGVMSSYYVLNQRGGVVALQGREVLAYFSRAKRRWGLGA
jgi:hypothetical protein